MTPRRPSAPRPPHLPSPGRVPPRRPRTSASEHADRQRVSSTRPAWTQRSTARATRHRRKHRIAAALAVLALVSMLPAAGAAAQQPQELCEPGDTTQFGDISADDYAAGYILCAKALGLTKGNAQGQFAADDNLSRAQMGVFLARLWRDVLGRSCPAGGHPFTDVPTGHWAAADIACIYTLGITKGTTATTYGPTASLTTAQITLFTTRVLNNAKPDSCATTTADELALSAQCLTTRNIAPNTTEATASLTANRAQMALYLIGTWHHATDRGQPPKPPTRPASTSAKDPNTPTYKTVTAGGHSCALRTDNTIECWGGDSYAFGEDVSQITDAPSSTFKAVTAGGYHSCGLRTDNTITCWGLYILEDSLLDAPSGAFKAITAGGSHSCGLRTDDTITCWGSNQAYVGDSDEYVGQADPPSGTFKAVTAGGSHSCGLRTDNTITCWGNNEVGAAYPPSGTFKAVTAGGSHSCGLRTDNTITCWGNNLFGAADPPSGTFKAVTAGGYHSCGLRTDNTITCWGYNEYGAADPPSGTFTAVAAGELHSCGLRTDDSIVCWGDL